MRTTVHFDIGRRSSTGYRKTLELSKFLAKNRDVVEAFYQDRRTIDEDFKIEDSEDLEDALATRVEPKLAYRVGSLVAEMANYFEDDLDDAARDVGYSSRKVIGDMESIVVEGTIMAMDAVINNRDKTAKAILASILSSLWLLLEDYADDNDINLE